MWQTNALKNILMIHMVGTVQFSKSVLNQQKSLKASVSRDTEINLEHLKPGYLDIFSPLTFILFLTGVRRCSEVPEDHRLEMRTLGCL